MVSDRKQKSYSRIKKPTMTIGSIIFILIISSVLLFVVLYILFHFVNVTIHSLIEMGLF